MHPPRPAEWLLQRLLDPASREPVLGDLHEGYLAVRQRRGAPTAYGWYVWQAARSVIVCRLTGRRETDARRFDFEPGPRASVRDVVRPALRLFRDHPLYALASSGTLALAIAAACVSLVVVRRAFIDPLPYRSGHELVSLLTFADGMTSAMSPHVLEDLRASAPPFVEFAGIRPTGAAYTANDVTETVAINFVDREYFALLGVSPAAGRIWTPQEPHAVVISARFLRDRLGRVSDAVGTSIAIDGRARTIVGVMPADFVPPYFSTADVWAPIDMATLLADIRSRRTLTVLARRAPAATQFDVEAYMALFSRQLQERFPAMHGGHVWVARPLREELVGPARPALIATAAAAGLLLLIVGANIAGLSTAHAVAVRRQLAVRAALGATRARLFIEQLGDSLVLALVGSVAGVWIAYALVQVAARYQRYFLPQLPAIALDATTALFGVLAGLAVGLAAALLPRSVVGAAPSEALMSSRGAPQDATVTAARMTLVVAQIAVALVLLVGAVLLVRTVQHLAQRELGFDSTGLAWLQVNLPGDKYRSSDAQLQFERDILDRVTRIPGVKSAIASVGFPLWGGMMAGLGIKGEAPGTPRREVAYLSVSPNFVRDVGARLIAGRDLAASDHAQSPRVVVVNETMARMFWPGGNAIGAEVQIGPGSPNERWITVVGVVADMRAHGLTEPIRPTSFGTTLQYSWPRRHIAVRTDAPAPAGLATELRAAVHAVDPAVAVGAVTSAAETLGNSMARPRLVMFTLGLYGGVALVLCLSGLYVVIVLSSQQRRREYAIRLALGASRGGVRWMVLRQALLLAGAGAATGLLLAAAATRTLQGLLHGVQPIDDLTFAGVALALIAAATLAAWQPAYRAERVSPAETLRAE